MAAPSVSTIRQFVTIAAGRPELGREAYLAGPAVLHGRLEVYLIACTERDDLTLANPAAAARILAEMFKGDSQLRSLMTGDVALFEERIAAHVDQAVALVLHGARPKE